MVLRRGDYRERWEFDRVLVCLLDRARRVMMMTTTTMMTMMMMILVMMPMRMMATTRCGDDGGDDDDDDGDDNDTDVGNDDCGAVGDGDADDDGDDDETCCCFPKKCKSSPGCNVGTQRLRKPTAANEAALCTVRGYRMPH